MDKDEVRKVPKEWTEWLSLESQPVTLLEYMAGCLSRLLGAQIEATNAARHMEGMAGAREGFDEAVAERMGIRYTPSFEVKKALDIIRNENGRAYGEQDIPVSGNTAGMDQELGLRASGADPRRLGGGR